MKELSNTSTGAVSNVNVCRQITQTKRKCSGYTEFDLYGDSRVTVPLELFTIVLGGCGGQPGKGEQDSAGPHSGLTTGPGPWSYYTPHPPPPTMGDGWGGGGVL
jgi:hypothetical protein